MVFHNETLRITKAPPPSPSLKSKVVGMVMMAFLFIVRFLFVFTFYNIYDVIAEILRCGALNFHNLANGIGRIAASHAVSRVESKSVI